jgi:hypothetical protein
MPERRFDDRKHDTAYWADHLERMGVPLSKPALAIARQRLAQWCALNEGLTAEELRLNLEDVQSVLLQAGVRQGVLRRPSAPSAPQPRGSSPHLRIIK